MPASLVQHTFLVPGGLSRSVPLSITSQQSGDLNVLAIGWLTGTEVIWPNVSDNNGPYTMVLEDYDNVEGAAQVIAYRPNIQSGSNTITVSFTNPVTGLDIRFAEFSGIVAVNPVDNSVSDYGNSNQPNSGYVAYDDTQSPKSLVYAAAYTSDAVFSAGDGFNLLDITSPLSNAHSYIYSASQGPFRGLFSQRNIAQWISQVVVFKSIS